MPVQITINGESATQAIEEFAILSAAFVGQAVLEATSTASTASTEEPKKQTRKPTPKKKEDSEEKKVEVESEDEESAGGETQEGADPKHTLVDLRALAKEKSTADASTKPKIKEILSEFGYANMSAVEDKDVDAIYAKLEAL
ncbi:hypothetical protein [Paenibacillus bouchesdurhonensis]|uniref:hypothetical protein n=1 Tax=Paenibacillus bouchesdurhonensis TaxID=1870990 RepID=UPI000DA63C14|nr:hypothetical protein [Paenibacillus bouchesdurhonensis]